MMARLARILVILAALIVAPSLAFAYEEAQLRAAEQQAQALQSDLRRAAALVAEQTTDEGLNIQRRELEAIRGSAMLAQDEVAGPLSEVTRQVEQLGPPPDAGTTEAPAIAVQRQILNTQLSRLNAVKKIYELIVLEADQALTRLTSQQRGLFLQRIFRSGRSVLDPRLWIDMGKGLGSLWQRSARQISFGLGNAWPNASASGLLILPIGLIALWFFLFKLVPSIANLAGLSLSSPAAGQTESGLLRLWRVIWGVIKLHIYLLAAVLLAVVALEAANLFTPLLQPYFQALLNSIFPAISQGGIAYLITAPRHPERRLIAIDSNAARTLTLITAVSAFALGIGEQLSALASLHSLPVSFTVGQSAFTAIILIVLVALGLIILRKQAAAGLAGDGSSYYLIWFLKLIPLLWVLLAVAVLALVFGFIALSYFIAGNLLKTAILVVLFGVFHAFADAMAKALHDPLSKPGQWLRRLTGWGETGIGRLVLLFRTVADAILVLTALFLLISIWTVVLFDFSSVLTAAGQGIKLGNITISPGAMAVALVIFVIGTIATRFFTRWLETRVLTETHLDKGVQNSLRAVAGYAGYALAAAFALSAAGVEFSNLAIIAGALGVGIGFGLQSIVNNFVSGLILLAERPVRVGDWVVTDAGEGLVKKINVRSTEIETFDNCTIIVPNSQLITNAVRNWTHRDSSGRFVVSVAVNHGNKAEDVIRKLVDIASEHPKVLRHPAPFAQVSRVGPQAIEFDLRGHLANIFDIGIVTSDLRLAITRAFTPEQLTIKDPAWGKGRRSP